MAVVVEQPLSVRPAKAPDVSPTANFRLVSMPIGSLFWFSFVHRAYDSPVAASSLAAALRAPQSIFMLAKAIASRHSLGIQ
jgi:hypothetical protein